MTTKKESDGFVAVMNHRDGTPRVDLGQVRLDQALELLAEGASVAWDAAGFQLDPRCDYLVGAWNDTKLPNDDDDVESAIGCLVPIDPPRRVRWRGWHLCRLLDGSLAWREGTGLLDDPKSHDGISIREISIGVADAFAVVRDGEQVEVTRTLAEARELAEKLRKGMQNAD